MYLLPYREGTGHTPVAITSSLAQPESQLNCPDLQGCRCLRIMDKNVCCDATIQSQAYGNHFAGPLHRGGGGRREGEREGGRERHDTNANTPTVHTHARILISIHSPHCAHVSLNGLVSFCT
jgi:hypothetical protein